MDPVAPPSNFSAVAAAGGVNLTWSSAPDTVAGYHVYRAASSAGPFIRLSNSLISGTSFTDPSSPAGSYTYMVRSVALQTNSSGTYFNPSQGVFATSGANAAIILQTTFGAGGLRLSWNSSPGTVYRVLTTSDLALQNWMDVSGPISASSSSTTWTNSNTGSSPTAFYRLSAQ